MKEIIKINNRLEFYSTKELIIAVLTHFLVFLVGVATTRAVVFESLIPFGISFISGVSFTYLPLATLGVFSGYLFPAIDYSPFRYLATLFAILTVKILIKCLFINLFSFIGYSLAISRR